MAGRATTAGGAVVKGCGSPVFGGVAQFTIIAAWDVGVRLAADNGVVVAASASGGGRGMVKTSIRPVCCVVAIVTAVVAGDMAG